MMHYKTKSMSAYEQAVKIYFLMNQLKINGVNEYLTKISRSGYSFEFDRFFFFHTSSLYTKKGTVKKMDVTNRIKVHDDALCKLIEIDDRNIFHGFEQKLELTDANIEECVTTKISYKAPEKVTNPSEVMDS
jgi:hypothetical protein